MVGEIIVYFQKIKCPSFLVQPVIMIGRKTDYLVLFIALAFIHLSLSAIFMNFKRTHPKNDYIKSRSASKQWQLIYLLTIVCE